LAHVEIVAREDEVAALHAFFDGAGEGPAAIVLEGDAGIGKSTLWLAGVEAARGRSLRVLCARPAEAEQGLAHAALGDLLGTCAAEVLPELSTPRQRALKAALLLDGGDGPPADSRALAVAVHSVLGALAERGPIVIAIDDVQWLDSSSADALAFALRRLDGEHVRMLLSRRHDQIAPLELALPGGIERLQVDPLSLGAIQAVVRDRLGRTFPRSVMVRLHEVSGGNPFFALELARALAAADVPLDPAQPLPVPESLERLVGGRLSTLPEETRAALLVVAVTGAPSISVIETVGIAAQTLVPAVAAQVLEPANGGVRFVHPLLASAVISDATEAERRAAHRLVATAVDEPISRARHVAAALEQPDAEVASSLEDAAEVARKRGASSVAAELGEAAARSTPLDREDDRRRRLIRAAKDHLAAGSAERGFALARELLEDASPGRARGEALALLGYLESWTGVRTGIRTAVEHFRKALRESDLPAELELELHAYLALLTASTEGLTVGEEHAREAVRLGERLGDDALAARTLATLAIVRFNQGEPESFALARRAVELARRSGDAIAIDEAASASSHCLLWSGRIDEARLVLDENLRSLAQRDEPGTAEILSHLALVEVRAGHLALAREHAERSLEMTSQYAGQDCDDPWCNLPLAHVAAYQGDEKLARELAERASADAETRGLPGRAHLALLGTLDHWAGDPVRALERYETFDKERRAAGFCDAISIHLADHVESLLEVGRAAEALDLLERWESESRSLGHRRAIAEAIRCRGLVAANAGDVVAAVELLEEAILLHEEVGDPFGRSRALLLLGVTLRRARKKGSAREAIEGALAGFDAIGAAAWVEKARAELGSIGGRTRENGLTPAERRVAILVAGGRTNREVAAALFLGERTVETHLSHVYAKLGIRSRTELARTLR
jgi:DNA-binding CsgD family transcriptional regulator